MPKNTPYPVPQKGKILQWAMQNEDALIEIVQWVNKMKALEVNPVTPGGYNTAKQALVESSDNIVLPIVSVFPNTYAILTGTALRSTFATSTITTAQLAGIVMAMQQDMLAIGQMKTA